MLKNSENIYKDKNRHKWISMRLACFGDQNSIIPHYKGINFYKTRPVDGTFNHTPLQGDQLP